MTETAGDSDPGWAAGRAWATTHGDLWGLKPIADGDVDAAELRESVGDERLPPASNREFWDRFVAGVASYLVDEGAYAPDIPDEYV